ncbi:MAG: hypothetical protein JSW55_14095, partial [Chloroflexota bacterium]
MTSSPNLNDAPGVHEATPKLADCPELGAQAPVIQPVEQIDLDRVPEVDTDQHSVPLDEIIFDSFRSTNRAVPLTSVQPDLIRSLRDAIPPIYEPRFVSVAESDRWLGGSDIVLGYADGGEAFAGYGESLNAGGRFFFPVSDAGRDPRLEPGEIVLGLSIEDTRRAYPLGLLGDVVAQDKLGS